MNWDAAQSVKSWAKFVKPEYDTRTEGMADVSPLRPEDAVFAPPRPDEVEKPNENEGQDLPDADRDGCTLLVEGLGEEVRPEDIARRFAYFAALREPPSWDGANYRVVFAQKGDMQVAAAEVVNGATIGGVRAHFRALKA